MLDNLSKILPYVVITMLVISAWVSIKRRNRTIEKEKAWTVLKRTKNSNLFISGISSLILLHAHFGVYPALINVYKAFNQPQSTLLEVAPYTTFVTIIIIIVLALYTYFSKSVDQEFEENLKKYKDGEKIKIRDLIGKKLNFLTLSIIILPVVTLVIFAALPGFQIITMAENIR